ncbi:KH domain-containing protein, partial [bacterium]|nr:KH domain-containing protein [bacterium]
KKGIFKKVTIEVYELSDAIEFAEGYLKNVTAALGIVAETTTVLKDDIIHISLNSDHNPILIGKNGKTLQALNELTRLAVSSKYKKRFRILLDINDYKDGKYSRVAFAARRAAKEVQKTKMDATLEAMPADERRIVHNALANFSHIKTESAGEGNHRAVVIKYID